eukprot:s151_g36.t1
MNELTDLATQCGVPPPLIDKIIGDGYNTPSLFAFSFSTAEALDTKILTWLAADEDEEQEDDDVRLTSPFAGAIRALWHHSFHEISSASMPAATPTSDPPSLESRLAWTDLPPPKLSAEHVLQLKAKFRTNYPGELLTAATTPCLRLLSQVMHQTRPGNCLEWLPWKCLVSEEHWNRAQEAKVSKTFKPGSALLASALVEDVPELDDIQGNPFFLSRVLEVRRNAYVLVGIAHLGAWKEVDSKVMEHYTKTYAPFAKGGKSKGKASPRPGPYERAPAKGKGKTKPGKGSVWPDAWAKTLPAPDGTLQEVCKRFHTTGCNFPKCKFLHRCPVILPSGSACNLPHKATDHPAALA